MITGESEPVDNQVNAHDPNALEAKNIIFNGSLVVDGGCYAVVIRTGDATLIGTLVEMTGDVGKAASTLKVDIEHFVKVLTVFALIQAASVFIVGLSRGLDPVDVFIQGFVVIMIGNVPQGLPTTVTACLYLVAENMGRQNVFVKKLDVIETLGSCTLICTDKTGTLTMNEMTVANAWVFGSKMTSEQMLEKCKEDKAKGETAETSQFLGLLRVGMLNSRVVLEKKTEDSPWEPNGDATELGLYRYCKNCINELYGREAEDVRKANPKVHEIPFNSSFKWQMSVHQLEGQNKQLLFLKGAPDVLLSKCSHYVAADGSIKAIDEEFNKIYTEVYEEFGGGGERVLGFTMKMLDKPFEELSATQGFKEKLKDDMVGKKTDTPTKDLIFVGLITLMDPPRAEVPQAVRECHAAGVKVVMVTGDHPLTAAAIARKIGLITLPTREVLSKERGIPLADVPEDDIKAVVVHGQQIPAMTEEDWKTLVSKQEIVFARTSPEQKLTIVKEFTKAGNVTAMTGDGVNDSPALKQAAIGIAMGLNGSAVAKEAADVVLLDDNFASIVIGIREGRLLFANLKKSIAYTLAHLTPEVVPVLLWGYIGMPQPVGSLMILCIDLLTELVPATSFAFETAEALIMQVPPRNVNTEKLTSFQLLFYTYGCAGMIITIGCFFVYFRSFAFYDVPSEAVWGNNNKYFPKNFGNFVTPSGNVYNGKEQQHILNVVRTGWFLTIVAGQAAHVWFARTSTMSLFEHGVFKNKVTNYGVCIAVCLGIFVAYTPGIRYVVASANPISLEIFYASLFMTWGLFSFNEGRKWITRNYPKDFWVNRWCAW